jgi:hypothetical protein
MSPSLAAAFRWSLGASLCTVAGRAAAAEPLPEFVRKYCLECHDDGTRKGDLSFEKIDLRRIEANRATWEAVAKKLDHRQMPPLGEERPDEAAYRSIVAQLHGTLDKLAAAQPDPGRTDTFRRLTRTEYQNAIRDLLAVEIDATALLPQDEPSHGFDNVTVGTLSPTLMERYVTAAQKIARLAVGSPRKVPDGATYRVPPDVTQEEHVDGLPLGTRGGAVFRHVFPLDGEYEIQVRLARDRNENVEGLRRPHEVEVLIDRGRIALETVKPPSDRNSELVDAHLKFRVTVKAGPRDLGVTFVKQPTQLIETERVPFIARYNMHRHPRQTPALYQVSVTGPFQASGAGDTPSRRRIFGDGAGAAGAGPAAGDLAAARQVLEPIVRRAYRRPVTDDDLRRPLEFFRDGAAEGAGFEAGIEHAVSAVLVSPQFLFRVERDPAGLTAGSVYRVSDVELASRLSFFLWSSLPDDELIAAAGRGQLRDPAELERQVRRMLADPRARNLATNFASQWLHLRKLDGVTPDLRLFPNFDDNLRQAFRQETELFIGAAVQEDRPIGELLQADHTYVNERLARHYGIPHVHGSHFRRVALTGEAAGQRGGLLRHGSVLTVTSYATRTSPVIRGHWVLENFVGAPPPPPPPDVPSLDDNTVSAALPIRARLAKHRENPSCASCHNVMDPVGFALENFDAVGRWRTMEERKPVDATGGLPDGRTAVGVAELERGLLERPEHFAGAVTEKLLVFALGRGLGPNDAATVRGIARGAAAAQFRWSALILGVVNSTPFQNRRTP